MSGVTYTLSPADPNPHVVWRDPSNPNNVVEIDLAIRDMKIEAKITGTYHMFEYCGGYQTPYGGYLHCTGNHPVTILDDVVLKKENFYSSL